MYTQAYCRKSVGTLEEPEEIYYRERENKDKLRLAELKE